MMNGISRPFQLNTYIAQQPYESIDAFMQRLSNFTLFIHFIWVSIYTIYYIGNIHFLMFPISIFLWKFSNTDDQNTELFGFL